jgi:hypothetical protein
MFNSTVPLALLVTGGTSLAPERRVVMALGLVLVLVPEFVLVLCIIGFMLQAPSPSKVTNKLLYKTARQ